jgi:hypothetical protein
MVSIGNEIRNGMLWPRAVLTLVPSRLAAGRLYMLANRGREAPVPTWNAGPITRRSVSGPSSTALQEDLRDVHEMSEMRPDRQGTRSLPDRRSLPEVRRAKATADPHGGGGRSIGTGPIAHGARRAAGSAGGLASGRIPRVSRGGRASVPRRRPARSDPSWSGGRGSSGGCRHGGSRARRRSSRGRRP